jgi:hypothetical protein
VAEKLQLMAKSREEFLQNVLADEFRIVRSKAGAPHQKQNKAAMIAWVSRGIQNHRQPDNAPQKNASRKLGKAEWIAALKNNEMSA